MDATTIFYFTAFEETINAGKNWLSRNIFNEIIFKLVEYYERK
jgi:hypothetical protein